MKSLSALHGWPPKQKLWKETSYKRVAAVTRAGLGCYLWLTPADALPVCWCSTRKHCCTALSSGLKSSLLVQLGYMGHVYDWKRTTAYHIALPCKASSVSAHSLCAQNEFAFILDTSGIFFSVHYANTMLEHELKVTFPRTDPSGCVIPVSLHTAGLGLSARLLKPLVPQHHFFLLHGVCRHEGSPSLLQYLLFCYR